VSSPFDPALDGSAGCLLLANAAGQHSLWPRFAEIPAGWTVLVPATTHRDCIDRLKGNAR
jgi:MbtH protein